ncbi:MAG: trypsin-like peptidase domain-containing protein [Gammaproteobacteria bacterium]|nr:trypsin-like peptidase domain-containing protein [Gammaproteobacteria bacterium]MCW9004123.1 trypsin-like peptidase domain-containing protein [Gammaproteobacteria bacterium]MCW9055226.1 trypsin-like peptidase domain-containing protein [Gammaproteobacteria bacterium]
MINKKHSTHFLLGWAIAGLIIGALILSLWPNTTQNGFDHHAVQTDAPSSYANAVAIASPAVVSIQAFRYNEQIPSLLDPFGNNKNKPSIKPSQGSGVIVDNNGHILTNYHVISKADAIMVTFNDGHKTQASIVGSDPDTDLAVLTIEHTKHISIRFADAHTTSVGDIVLAIGNPYGIGQTVTQGIISATGRNRVGLNTYENFIQTDAAINPGNSGGALINTRGEIVGINSAIFTPSGSYQGISFAIPANMALSVMQQIIEKGGVVRGWLGVEGVDLNPQMLQQIGLSNIQGVLITDVFENGPADKAKLAVGDIITQINQLMIRDTRDVLDIVARGRPGDKIEISGIRERQSFITQAILDQRPESSN